MLDAEDEQTAGVFGRQEDALPLAKGAGFRVPSDAVRGRSGVKTSGRELPGAFRRVGRREGEAEQALSLRRKPIAQPPPCSFARRQQLEVGLAYSEQHVLCAKRGMFTTP
jgi:hypothetical protein